MAKISQQALSEVKGAYQVYEKEVQASKLRQTTKKTYLDHSYNFIRWLDGRFIPGDNIK